MGVDYFNCKYCKKISNDNVGWYDCICGTRLCVDCGDELKEKYPYNESSGLHDKCFVCIEEEEKKAKKKVRKPRVKKNNSKICRFEIHRSEDVTGNSGIGKICEGVQFSNGKCVIMWTTEISSIVIHDNIENVQKIICSHSKSEIKYLD